MCYSPKNRKKDQAVATRYGRWWYQTEISETESVSPVSYTHLDAHKRQPLSLSANIPTRYILICNHFQFSYHFLMRNQLKMVNSLPLNMLFPRLTELFLIQCLTRIWCETKSANQIKTYLVVGSWWISGISWWLWSGISWKRQ